MTYTPHEIIQVSLNPQEYELAHGFAVEQDTPQKGKQVYLNTLAVLVVHNFLEWLGIETNLDLSDSWNPAVRCFHDVADLVVPNLGKIECRPVLLSETIISLPKEVTEDRIAYIGVRFTEQLNEIQLLGFCPAIDSQPQEIKISNLESIETLIDYIDLLESALEVNMTRQLKIVNLSEWLQNINDAYDDTWQKLEDFAESLENSLVPTSFSIDYSRDNKSRRFKKITLRKYLLALMIKCSLENNKGIYIHIRLYSILAEQAYLPFGIKMEIFDESKSFYRSIPVKSSEHWIQAELRGMRGEKFSIKIGLEDVSVIENFVI